MPKSHFLQYTSFFVRSASLILTILLACAARAHEPPKAGRASETLIADAAEQLDFDLISRLLALQVDVNKPQGDGMSALHWAVYHDQPQIVSQLLSAGANVSSTNKFGIAPLTIACQNGSEIVVKLLLRHNADPNTVRDGNEAVLATASRSADTAVVKSLLSAGAAINRKDSNGQTALMWAAAAGNSEIVELLLRHDADQTIVLDSGFTALFFAVRNGHINVVKQLLSDDTDVNQVLQNTKARNNSSSGGMSLLMLAIENAHFELAQFLLEAGADPNDDRTGFTPLQALSWVRKPEIGDNDRGNPPPRGSGKLTSLAFAKKLVEHGADVNLPKRTNGGRRLRISVKGTTPFLCAASTADMDYMQTLIELGADPQVKNTKNQHAVFMAAGIDEGPNADGPGTAEEHLAAVRFLLELTPYNLDELDANEQTVMHAAAYKSLPKVVHLFDKKGANIHVWNRPNKQGRTPLDISRGDRPGNFKPDFDTEVAITEVMQKHNVTIPPSRALKPPTEKKWNP